MSTESIERDIVLSYEAGEKLKRIMNEPIKYTDNNSLNIMKQIEEGKKILKKLFNKEETKDILQQKLKNNMDKAVEIVNKNTIRNEQGHVVISKDDEWLNDTEYDEIIEK